MRLSRLADNIGRVVFAVGVIGIVTMLGYILATYWQSSGVPFHWKVIMLSLFLVAAGCFLMSFAEGGDKGGKPKQ